MGPFVYGAGTLAWNNAGHGPALLVRKESPVFSISDGKKRFGNINIVFMEIRTVIGISRPADED
jgi:hypothetical protein